LKSLAPIGMTRASIFDALKEVSIPETTGCWAGATGNFDEQIVSVRTLQWNYGQSSIQPLMRRYKESFRSEAMFLQELSRIMPSHGHLIFSNGCLRAPMTDDCRNSILALQERGTLSPSLNKELDALFESDAMIQIQTDRFIALLQGVRNDLQRVFRKKTPTLRQIKWAIDTKVQQGQFPGDADSDRVRDRWSHLTDKTKRSALLALVAWYEGLSGSADQGGTTLDRSCNLRRWRETISAGEVTMSRRNF
jgi:hypothetical protein